MENNARYFLLRSAARKNLGGRLLQHAITRMGRKVVLALLFGCQHGGRVLCGNTSGASVLSPLDVIACMVAERGELPMGRGWCMAYIVMSHFLWHTTVS